MFGLSKGRLADANRNLGVRTLLLLGELGKAMGPPIERAARPCLGPALQCLADKKKPVRRARGPDKPMNRHLCCFLCTAGHARHCSFPVPLALFVKFTPRCLQQARAVEMLM